VFFLLEREGFDCDLYQASQVKVLPGRPKTDKLDSVWLAKITERGSLAGSFVPPKTSACCARIPATAGS
jgi:transposase